MAKYPSELCGRGWLHSQRPPNPLCRAISPSGSLSLAFVRQPAEDRAADDLTGLCSRRLGSRLRELELQRLMRARGVVVADEFAEHMPQVPLVHDDEMVEALAPERAREPLGDPLACGVAIGVSTVRMPMRLARATKSPPYERSRSRIR